MKGCQKRIIVMKNTGSRLFDEAYFILKENAVRTQAISEHDMVGEAARIISENMLIADPRLEQPRHMVKLTSRPEGGYGLYMLLRWYVAGVLTAAFICAAILLFLR